MSVTGKYGKAGWNHKREQLERIERREQPTPAGEGAQETPQIACPACGIIVKQVASVTLDIALWQHWNWACLKRSVLPPERAALVGEIVSLLPHYDLSLLKGGPMLNGAPMAADYRRLWETTHRVLRAAAAALKGERGRD